MLVTLLTLAVGALLVPTLAARLNTPAAQHGQALSHATAVVLLLVYIASVPFWLSGGPGPGGQVAQKGEVSTETETPSGAPGARPPWPLSLAITLLVVAGVGSAGVSDWFVSSLSRPLAPLASRPNLLALSSWPSRPTP